MTQASRSALRQFALAAAVLVSALAGPVFAQDTLRADARVEPWRTPEETPPKPKNATSDASATAPTDSEQREARKLATAIFATPGAAAARAADKAAPPSTSDIPPAEPKAEWLAKDGLRSGGDGVKVTTPF